MKKIILATLIFFACFVNAMAQQAKIGYFSYSAVMTSLPDHALVLENIAKLRAQYEEEMKSVENEFNEKYEYFLEEQAALDEPIRKKRQADLQALLDRNVKFRKEAERLISEAEQKALAPLAEKISAALKKVGADGGLFVIVNTDSNACPYIDPALAEDVTAKVQEAAK